MASKSDIQCEARDLFDFSAGEIAEIVAIYNWPSWPESLNAKKVAMLKEIFEERLHWIIWFGCCEQDIHNLSDLLVNKCLFSCDVAKYAQWFPIIGKIIKVGKFPIVLHAMKEAVVEYVYFRSTWHNADESIEWAKFIYWNDIRETLGF